VTERACAGAAFLATRAWTMGVATAERADMMRRKIKWSSVRRVLSCGAVRGDLDVALFVYFEKYKSFYLFFLE